MKTLIRIVTYSRVSTSHHDQNPQIQVRELEAYCKGRGWAVSEAIVDYGSGGSANREGLKRLLELVATGQVDCIVVTKLDRLFRSLRQLVTALDDFQAKGIAFIAMKDSIDYTTPSGRLFTQILGSLAEFERTLIRERTIAGLEYARAVKGKRLGRPKQQRNVALIEHLKNQNLSNRQIAKLVGCSHVTVGNELRSAVKNRST